jgi:hypothetical protein
MRQTNRHAIKADRDRRAKARSSSARYES